MASPPFDVLEAKPANTDIVSQHPADERSMRDIVESALAVEHDMGAGSTMYARHKFGVGNDATRNAITSWVVGSIWFNTKTSPATLQRVVSVGPVVWEDVVAGGGGFVSPLTTRGDLLTRSASAHVRLALGAANRVLRSDGTDPSWAQVALATDVSGNLAVANLGGGTGASSLTFWRGDGSWAASPAGIIVAQSGAIGAGVTEFISPGGGSLTEAAVQWSLPGNNYTIRNLAVHCQTAAGAGQTYIYTFRKNGADTSLTATLPNSVGPARDVTHTVSVASTDLISVKVVASAGAAGTGSHWASFELVPV